MSSPDQCDTQCDEEELTARIEDELPSPEHLRQLAALFGLLADETRLKILTALASYDELCVCDIAHAIDRSVSATSHQLRKLRDSRVVVFRREGRMTYYRLRDRFPTTLLRKARRQVEERAA